MSPDFEQTLEQYAELTVKVGLNLQPGQRLLIGEPIMNNGVSLHAAPLVRKIAASAYKAGARFVGVMWADDQIHRVRFQHAPRDSFAEYPTWQSDGLLAHAEGGDALLTVLANDPDLLSDQDPDLVATAQQATLRHIEPAMAYVTRNATNWSVVSAAVPGWAAKVFSGVAPEDQEARLWDAIFRVCRLDQADPVAAWQAHVDELVARSDYLNHKQYTGLRFIGPGTDLTLGLPRGHVWSSARMTSQAGVSFTANLPTEEIFTLPDRGRAEGVIATSKPLSYGGALIEDLSLTFAGGRVVDVSASKGEAVLRKLLETDEGAGRLGEVALLPHSSPISQSGLLFYNILIDENAASHLALGRAYRFSLEGGEAMSDDAFTAAGGNQSVMHVDFMIGSGEMDVDGLAEDGAAEPLMRGGEWAFEV
jgi:aminopeptidase